MTTCISATGTPGQRAMCLLCMAMALAFLVSGLWPFDFRPSNRVGWMTNRAGLQFQPLGIVYEPEPLPTRTGLTASTNPAAATLELWLEPALEPSDNVAHIFTVHDGRLPSAFVLCQWKRELLLRVPRARRRGVQEAAIQEALITNQPRQLTLVCDGSGTSWYLDGHLAKTAPGFTLPPDALNGQLILGDAAAGKHSWSGRLYGVALFDRALEADTIARHSRAWTEGQALQLARDPGLLTLLLFDEQTGEWVQDRSPHAHRLRIPATYRTLHKTVLAWRANVERLDVRDLWLNLLGFVLFGFLLYWYRRSTTMQHRLETAATVVGVGAALSLFIELTQVWLPNRDSSSLDLACNITGTLIGVCLAILVRSGPIKRRRRRRA